MTIRRSAAFAALLGAAVLLAAPSAGAQPDGLPGRVVHVAPGGTPVVFRFAPRDSAAAAALAERVRSYRPPPVAAIEMPPDSFEVLVAPTEDAFRALTAGRVPDWGLAVAFPDRRRIVVRSPRLTGAVAADPAVVLRHELGHLWLAAAAGDEAPTIPRWFHEGFAALYAGEWRWVDPFRLAWGRVTGGLTPLGELERGIAPGSDPGAAYVQSLAAVRDLRERGGDEAIGALLARIRGGATFDGALRETYGITLDQFYAEWESHLGREYGWAVALTDERGLWIALAIVVAILWVVRRRHISREIAARKRREDEALGPPGDHSLGAEEWERYWEWEDDAWRGEGEEGEDDE